MAALGVTHPKARGGWVAAHPRAADGPERGRGIWCSLGTVGALRGKCPNQEDGGLPGAGAVVVVGGLFHPFPRARLPLDSLFTLLPALFPAPSSVPLLLPEMPFPSICHLHFKMLSASH